jgi:ribosomal RNA-processing protein 12
LSIAASPSRISCPRAARAWHSPHTQFGSEISKTLRTQIIENVLVLLGSKQREVVKSSLGFVKVLFSVLPSKELKGYLGPLSATLVTWPDDIRRHFRAQARFILQRLARKFGCV